MRITCIMEPGRVCVTSGLKRQELKVKPVGLGPSTTTTETIFQERLNSYTVSVQFICFAKTNK